MAIVAAFHSTKQAKKPVEDRIYHTSDRCFSARDIALYDRIEGDNGYALCVECTRLSGPSVRTGAENPSPE